MGRRGWLAIAATLAVLCAAALAIDRGLQFYIGRDSSLFLYVAQRLTEGGVPYRDVWDHKPPLLYFLDVVALALTDRGLPGVDLVELLVLLLAAGAGFWGMYRTLGVTPALFGTVAWTTAIALILDGGNRPEEYAVALQFSALALYLPVAHAGPSAWRWLLVGVTAGLAVMLKPTVLGIWAAIYVAEAVRAWPSRDALGVARALAFGALGAVAVTLPVGLYLAANGALDDFVDQVIRYNVEYSRATLGEHLAALASGVELTLFSGLFPIAAAAWVTTLATLMRGAARPEPLFVVAAVAFPLDFLLASATGRPYREYFLGCLVAQAVLAAIAAAWLESAARRLAARRAVPARPLVLVAFALCALLFVSAIPAVAAYRREVGPNPQEQTRPVATAYVREHTKVTDSVLFWGAEGGLNYTTGRRAPTRYAYQYAFYMRDYQRPAQIDELLFDLARDPPALIVDASFAVRDVPPLDRATRAGWTMLEPKYRVMPEMDRLFAWIEEHYVRVDEVGFLRWQIYAPRTLASEKGDGR